MIGRGNVAIVATSGAGRRSRGQWRVWAAAAAVMLLASSLTMVASPGPALAATSGASALTATGSDATAGSTTDSATGATGTTRLGDTIDWALHYRNETGAPATVNVKDRIAGDQSFVPGSLKLPPGLAAQYSTDGGGTWAAGAPPADARGVGATGTMPAGTTNATTRRSRRPR